MERLFENMLWNSRLVVVVAVIVSLLTAFATFYITSVDAFFLFAHLGDYISVDMDAVAREDFKVDAIAHVVAIIDGYLLATVLLIFSLGLYELFISKIEQAEASETPSVLAINSLDDLKTRLGRVVIMILIVNFFERAIQMKIETPLDLLIFAGGIVLIGLTLFLTHAKEH